MRPLFKSPCTIVAGVKESGAAAFLARLLEEAHPGVITHIFAHSAASQVLRHLPRVMQVSDEAELNVEFLLRAYKPDFVLVGASAGWSIEKALTIKAKLFGLPVYAFIDNYMNTWQRFAHEVTAERWAYLPNRLYAISDDMATRLKLQGCPPNLIALTRHPVLETIATLAPSVSATEFKESLDIAKAEIVLTLVVETGMPDSDLWRWDNCADDIDPIIDSVLEKMLDFVSKSPRPAVVLIKLHPSDKKSFAGILKKYPSSIYREIYCVDKLALLDASTKVFGIGSMFLFEAAARTKRAYCIHENELVGYPYVSSVNELHIVTSRHHVGRILES